MMNTWYSPELQTETVAVKVSRKGVHESEPVQRVSGSHDSVEREEHELETEQGESGEIDGKGA